MAKSSPLVDYLLDTLDELGGVRSRAMFGGFGIFRDDLMVGLIADEVFYLKVDAENRPDFEKAGSSPFLYHRAGRSEPIEMSYWEVPADVLENGHQLRAWTDRSYEAARRNKQRSKPRKGRREK